MSTKPQKPTGDSGVIAALHRAGRGWRAVIGRASGSGVEVLDHREFDVDQTGHIDGWLSQHRVGRIVGVLPASSVICRTCRLPDASPEVLDMALRLQAEAHLLGTTPPHRQAMAVLKAAPGETDRNGLILAWPESAKPELPPVPRTMTFAPETTALAALLNGDRPTDPIMFLDRGNGTVAFALSHENGCVFRATREDPEEFDPWRQNVGRAVVETAMSVGRPEHEVDTLLQTVNIDTATVMTGDASLVIPPEIAAQVRRRVIGAPDDENWWTSYGIATGVLLASTDQQLAPLTKLELAPPMEKPSIVTRVVTTLRRPRAAAFVVVASIVAMMLGPLALSAGRVAVLHLKMPDYTERLAEIDATGDRLVMYSGLEKQAWSMTKLLGDIACVTPEGIEVDRVQLAHGESVVIDGFAKGVGDLSADDVVVAMVRQMNDSGVFADAIPRIGTNPNNTFGGMKEFNITAEVESPHRRPNYSDGETGQDFGAYPLQWRRYGPPDDLETGETVADAGTTEEPGDAPPEIATADPEPAVDEGTDETAIAAADEGEGERRPSGTGRRPNLGGSGAGDGVTGRGTEGNAISGRGTSADIPPPISQEQIDVLTLPETQQAMANVARARQLARNADDETKSRLKNEFEMLKLHMRKLQDR